MCGIVGILNRDRQMSVDIDLLNRMSKMISHRGPDDSGTYIKGHIGLGHRRLSIIDLATGHQPMVDELRGRVIVYNGEIYNYKTLKKELTSKGVQFHTNSDTEVLLNLVDTSDTRWLECLNGMFAFAFWEEKTKTLFLARDRLGIKPLYYVDLGDTFLFSSEIKPLLLYPNVIREVNESKIPEYLAFRSIAGTETMFKNIHQVPPGHAMILKHNSYTPEIVQYWSEGLKNDISTYVDSKLPFTEQFNELLVKSVKHRLISDVPLGTYNSGGVDSSLVTAIVKSLREGKLHTFSVGFEESSYDESKYAQIVAKQVHSTHHELVINEEDYIKALHETLWHLEEPINHPHTVQLLCLSKFTKEFVTVVLTGEGADELFAGYPRYNIPRICNLLRILPKFVLGLLKPLLKSLNYRRLTKLLEFINEDETALAIQNSRYVPKCDFQQIISREMEFPIRHAIYDQAVLKANNIIEKLLYYDQRAYLPSLLTRLDKMSMAASVEARVPFLDYRLIEWSYLIPTNLKLRALTNKWIVKKTAKQWLPNEIVHRKKVGFGVPIGKWLRNKKGLGMYLDILTDKSAKERGYYDVKALNCLISEHISGKVDHSEILWGLLNLELWQKEFIDKNFSVISD